MFLWFWLFVAGFVVVNVAYRTLQIQFRENIAMLKSLPFGEKSAVSPHLLGKRARVPGSDDSIEFTEAELEIAGEILDSIRCQERQSSSSQLPFLAAAKTRWEQSKIQMAIEHAERVKLARFGPGGWEHRTNFQNQRRLLDSR